ncbi:MAG: DUF6259 domain-containing protein [Oscillospiraceae bacterium]|nr:DUF6259 domain-containing protein [Oscillospiraceae bacterium]
MPAKRIKLETTNSFLEFDAKNLRLCSMRSKTAPEQEFIEFDETYPTFEMGYYESKKRYRLLSSLSAGKITIENPAKGVYTAVFDDFDGRDLTIECRVSVSSGDRFARFNVSIDNRCGLRVADVQYPFVVCPYKLGGAAGTEAVVVPQGYGSGRLMTGALEFGGSVNVQMNRMRPDSYQAWEFTPFEDMCGHYPGMTYAQFLAYYNDKAGLYLACDDTEANIKRFKVLHRKPGMRLGVSHAGDWNVENKRTLEYDTMLTTFEGDWYDAADIYREWSMKQKWFIPLTKKENVPKWLVDSPAYITIRSGGQLDMGDVTEIEEFVPYEKCVPLLQNIADKIDSPLCIVFMGWERAGSWVYPDCFPPIGGEESMKNAIAMMKKRGWHAGSFCSGTRWCYDQVWSGYDGRDYLDSINAEEGYCKTVEGNDWVDPWRNFRMNIAGCLGTEKMQKTGLEIVGRLVDWGMEALQYLDQNNGSATFPCFAGDHGHPAGPGKWMHEAMTEFVNGMHGLAKEKGEYDVVHSAESGLNEVCLPLFQQTELRVYPADYGTDTIPLYQYLFHECVVLQGMMGFGPEPYHLVIKNATNFILGGIPGGVLTGDGTLLDKDTSNWALWEPRVGNNDDALELMRSTLAMRRGAGKDFLVFGRMERPAKVEAIERVTWNFGGRAHNYAAVFHSAWQSQNGGHAVILANWTKEERRVTVRDGRFDVFKKLKLTACGKETAETLIENKPEGIEIQVPPLGCVIVVQ